MTGFQEMISAISVPLMVRFLVPLLILRWPLFGTVASLVVDAVDVYLGKLFQAPIDNYVLIDKYFDLYYLFLACITSLSWKNPLARNTSIILFVWRVLGVVGFHITGERIFLFIGQNLFENFFLFYLIQKKLRKKKGEWLNSKKRLIFVVFLLLALKFPQEYLLHFLQTERPIAFLFPWAPDFLK